MADKYFVRLRIRLVRTPLTEFEKGETAIVNWYEDFATKEEAENWMDGCSDRVKEHYLPGARASVFDRHLFQSSDFQIADDTWVCLIEFHGTGEDNIYSRKEFKSESEAEIWLESEKQIANSDQKRKIFSFSIEREREYPVTWKNW